MVAALLLALVGCAEPEVHHTAPLAAEIAEAAVTRWPPEQAALDWIPTVLGFGLHRLHAVDGDPRWQDWYRAWLAGAPASPAFHSSDAMSPALLAATLLREDPTADVTRVTDAAHAYLAVAPRTDAGAIEHWGEGSLPGALGQVWVDSMFMFGPFLIREHERGDPDALALFSTQYALFADACRDPGDQLYRHAWDDVAGVNIPADGVYWARGNAWVLVAAAELVAAHPGTPEARAVDRAFRRHLAAVLAAQAPDGLWRTVLTGPDDPANYTETSASALIAWSLARSHRAGVVDDDVLPALDAAVAGILDRVEHDGVPVVEGTSWGTNPGDYADYLAVGTSDDLMLGVGAVIALLAEVDGVERAP